MLCSITDRIECIHPLAGADVPVLFRKQDSPFQAWIIGGPVETSGLESPIRFTDQACTEAWLRGFEISELRRIAYRQDLSGIVLRLCCSHFIQHLASLILSGRLLVRFADPQSAGEAFGNSPSRSAYPADPAGRALLQLKRTAREFLFQGQRFRIITARQWPILRSRMDRSYRVLDRRAATELLGRLAEWSDISSEEKQALGAAKALVADTRTAGSDVARSGAALFAVRIEPGASAREKLFTEPFVTPTQRAPRPKEEVHWIEIVLVDAFGKAVPGQPFTLKLPDGGTHHGSLDSGGRARVSDIKAPGLCEVIFPDIDAKAWRVA